MRYIYFIIVLLFSSTLLTSQSWALPNCPSSGYFHNCFGTYTWAKSGNKYVGEFKNGTRHGQGTLTYTDGENYVGEWKDGDLNGHGIYTFASGNKYVGEFKDDKRNGQGTYTWVSGSKYVGEFKDGKEHGQGTYTWASGDKYVGEYKDGKEHGQGTYTWAKSGNKYVGEWMDGKRNGQGTYTYHNGDKYVGEYKDDKRNGQGTYTSANGNVKEGIWKDSEFQYAKKISPKPQTNSNEVLQAASGTGFIVSKDGHIVTNHHVLEGCAEVKIHKDGKVYKGNVIANDVMNDLALIKSNYKPNVIFPLSDKNPSLLQDIYVAGFPFGNAISSSVKVTKGVVSSESGFGNNYSNIQIDAALQQGNSGGPILDDKGNVVGVAVAKLDVQYAIKNFGSIPENINFGIKSSVVENLIQAHNVNNPSPYTREMNKADLGYNIKQATLYLSCWMTLAQIKKFSTKKVIFRDLVN